MKKPQKQSPGYNHIPLQNKILPLLIFIFCVWFAVVYFLQFLEFINPDRSTFLSYNLWFQYLAISVTLLVTGFLIVLFRRSGYLIFGGTFISFFVEILIVLPVLLIASMPSTSALTPVFPSLNITVYFFPGGNVLYMLGLALVIAMAFFMSRKYLAKLSILEIILSIALITAFNLAYLGSFTFVIG